MHGEPSIITVYKINQSTYGPIFITILDVARHYTHAFKELYIFF